MSMNPIHIATPLIPSETLTNLCGKQVLLKLDNLQPSGSFKIRGVGRLVQKAVLNGATRIICPSGGNAGLAALFSAGVLQVQVSIVVPQTTNAHIVLYMKQHGADVHIHGRNWNEAHAYAVTLAEKTGAALVHPFDHPDIWDGNSSLVHELPEQPSAIVLSVGGGGLAAGVIKGLRDRGWNNTTVVAMETEGANCFNAALQAKQPVTLPGITSIATTLGACRVCDGLFEMSRYHPVISSLVSDADAVAASLRFADEHRFLVEPSCGAALAAIYSGILKKNMVDNLPGPVIVEVCGGSAVTLQGLFAWGCQFNLQEHFFQRDTLL